MTVVSLAEIKLHEHKFDFDSEERVYKSSKTPSQETLEELIAADDNKKISEFTTQWFPFMRPKRPWSHPDFEEEALAVEDTRNLMLLALELKRMVDEDECSVDAFEGLGLIPERVKDNGYAGASLYYLASSPSFARYIRATCHCEGGEERWWKRLLDKGSVTKERLIEMKVLGEDGTYYYAPPLRLSYAPKYMIEEDGLFLSNQQDMVESLDPECHYPIMWFFAGNGPERYWGSPERAYFLLDDIMRACLQGVMMRTHHGALAPEADSNFTSLWICLSELFRESRITTCKTCGLPIIANKERGAKRLYCNDTCKRKYKRALKFASLVNDDGVDLQTAAKSAGIAAVTAARILERNGIHVNPAL